MKFRKSNFPFSFNTLTIRLSFTESQLKNCITPTQTFHRGVQRGGRQLVAAWERWGKGGRTGMEHAAASVVEDDRNSVEFLCHPQSINHFFGDNM